MYNYTLKDISNLVTQACDKKVSQEQMGEVIAQHLFKYYRSYGLRNEDEVCELVDNFWTRILSLPKRYTDTGSSFARFFVSSIHYMVLSTKKKKYESIERNTILFEQQVTDSASLMEEKIFSDVKDKYVKIENRANVYSANSKLLKSNILILCVKCARFLNDEEVTNIANVINYPPEKLLAYVADARSIVKNKKTLKKPNNRIAKTFMEIEIGRRKINRESDEIKALRLQKKLNYDMNRYKILAKQLPIDLSYSITDTDVGKIIGVRGNYVSQKLRKLFLEYGISRYK